MIRGLVIASLVAPLLGGCAVLDWFGRGDDTRVPDIYVVGDMPGMLEPIHAAAFTNDTALFQVTSNGCTEKADIEPVVRQGPDYALVTLRRLKADSCKALVADGVEVVFSFQELGLEPGSKVRVNNPYLIRNE